MNEYSWNELNEGLSQEFEVDLDQCLIADFVRLSGDTNPLHTSQAFAKKAGFVDLIAPGLLVSAFYSRLAGVYLPGKYCLLQGADIEFVKPCFPGDHLIVSGEICYRNEAFRRLEIRAQIRNQRGETVSRAKLRTGFREH